MDELKKHIQQHRDELDLEEPRPAVWYAVKDRLEANKPASKTNVVMMATRWAVAACLLLLAGIGWNYLMKEPIAQKPIMVQAQKELQKTLPQVPASEINQTEKESKPFIVKTHSAKKLSEINETPLPYISMEERKILSELESSYTQVINLQKDRLRSIPMYAESPDYFKDFKAQIRQLEKDEKILKSDIIKHGVSDVLLDQLINLYQQKLTVLKQLQIEMNKTNNRYKQNRVPIDTLQTYFLNL